MNPPPLPLRIKLRALALATTLVLGGMLVTGIIYLSFVTLPID